MQQLKQYLVWYTRGGGCVYSVQKTFRGRATNVAWVAKSASWYMNDPLQNAEFSLRMGRFFKINSNLSRNWLKFKKILEKSGDFPQNFPKIGLIGT